MLMRYKCRQSIAFVLIIAAAQILSCHARESEIQKVSPSGIEAKAETLSQVPPEALANCREFSYRILNDRGIYPSLSRVSWKYLPHIQRELGSWRNEHRFPADECAGSVSLSWDHLYEPNPEEGWSPRPRILARTTLECVCQYEASGRYFGDRTDSPDRLRLEQDLNQALWQAAWHDIVSNENKAFRLGSVKQFGSWKDPTERLTDETNTIEVLRGSKGFSIRRTGSLLVRVHRLEDGLYDVSAEKNSFGDLTKQKLLESFRIALNDKRFAMQNDNLIIRVEATNGSVPATPVPNPVQCKANLSRFLEVLHTGQRNLRSKKLTPEQAVDLVNRLAASDADVNLAPKPFTLSSNEYFQIKPLLIGLVPLVRGSKSLLLGDAPLVVPDYYLNYGAKAESLALQKVVLRAMACDPGKFAKCSNQLHHMLETSLTLSEGNARQHEDTCRLVLDVLSKWKADPTKGILPLGPDFSSLKCTCWRALRQRQTQCTR